MKPAVDKLSVPLADISESGATIDAEAAATDVQPDGVPPVPVTSVRVRGTLSEVGHEFLFHGTVSAMFVNACDRCLDDVRKVVEVDALWSFARGALADFVEDLTDGGGESSGDEEAAGIHMFEGDEIDLAPMVWEELVIAMPAKFLCKEDCAGLCAQCGANLNLGTCSCRTNDAIENKGLAGLADMFPELRPKHSEE